MLIALLAVGVLTVVPSQDPTNATPLRLKGRTVALTASQLGVTCVSCRLFSRPGVAQKTQEPTPPPLLVPNEEATPPPLLDADPQSPPAGELTPPPDAPAWQAPPERKLAPRQTVSDYDNNVGEWVGKEVLAGALTLIVTDVVVTGAITAIFIATLAASFAPGRGSEVVLGIFVAVGLALAHAVLSPLWCAIAVKAIADEPTANGLGGAALGAYLSAIGIGIVSFGIVLALSAIGGAAGATTGGGVEAISSLVTLAALLARWIGVPLASSWAMHRGEKRLYAAVPATNPRKLVVVQSSGREEQPLSGATILRF